MVLKDSGITKIVTGGQTGVDRAVLDVCLTLGISCGGWCPKGRLAEDGIIDQRYPLIETDSEEYAVRTEWNVRDSDATLVVSTGFVEGGTKLTVELAERYGKAYLVLDMHAPPDVDTFRQWLTQNRVRVLNVAGPRESLKPGTIYRKSRLLFEQLFR